MPVTSQRLSEERTISLQVNGAPDFVDDLSTAVLVPDRLDITYRWVNPDDRPNWHKPVVAIEISGFRRLKSGKAGTARASLRVSALMDRPQWLTDIVSAYTPQDWDA
jgi:hypothetical protein